MTVAFTDKQPRRWYTRTASDSVTKTPHEEEQQDACYYGGAKAYPLFG